MIILRYLPIFLFVLFVAHSSIIAANQLPVEKPPIFTNFCETAKTPADKQACTQDRYESSEAILNQQFSEFLRFLKNTSHADDMQTAQNAWITYRNKECAFEASFFEEEIAKRTLELSCLSRLTEERALTLYNFVPRTRSQNLSKESNLQE